MNKFCENCGTKLKPGAKFCPNCGAKQQVNSDNTHHSDTEQTVNNDDRTNSTVIESRSQQYDDNRQSQTDNQRGPYNGSGNPTKLARVGGKKDRDVTYLNLNQIKQVLNYCRFGKFPARECKSAQVGTPVLIEAAILSGCRLGELAGLTWDNVDVEHAVFHIRRQLDTRNHREPKFKDLKTDNSERDVAVPRYLIDDMKKLHADGDELIFYTQRNLPISTSSASRYTHRLLDRLKIDAPNFHFHSFRHSHVALLLAHDVDIYAISQRLGHTNVRTTLQIYSYLMDEKKEKEDKKILGVLNNLGEQTER